MLLNMEDIFMSNINFTPAGIITTRLFMYSTILISAISIFIVGCRLKNIYSQPLHETLPIVTKINKKKNVSRKTYEIQKCKTMYLMVASYALIVLVVWRITYSMLKKRRLVALLCVVVLDVFIWYLKKCTD